MARQCACHDTHTLTIGARLRCIGLCNQVKRVILLGLGLDGYRLVATRILGGVHHE